LRQAGDGFDPEKLWRQPFDDDDEAVELWRKVAGLPAGAYSASRHGRNYWSMGVPGPVSGPARRSTAARGPDYGTLEGGPEANEDRYIEIWNLVFMQNERGDGTSKEDFEILGPLPRRNIDTGLGVERHRVPAAGRGQRLRDRRCCSGHRQGRRVRHPADTER
jgi:alanyl-tRNA synthetase